jgi:hypothetical protein
VTGRVHHNGPAEARPAMQACIQPAPRQLPSSFPHLGAAVPSRILGGQLVLQHALLDGRQLQVDAPVKLAALGVEHGSVLQEQGGRGRGNGKFTSKTPSIRGTSEANVMPRGRAA